MNVIGNLKLEILYAPNASQKINQMNTVLLS